MHSTPTIAGIQQIGIGVPDAPKAFAWYREHFGMDIPIFEEAAEAPYMTRYTGGKVHSRHAILALNMRGGGGFEIWQFTSRQPSPCGFEILPGDLGIHAAIIKSSDVRASFDHLLSKGAALASPVVRDPGGREILHVRDPWGNLFRIVPSDDWFTEGNCTTGGVCGSVIGVTDIDASLPFYREILGYDEIRYDREGTFDDFAHLPGGDGACRRVLLTHSQPRVGAFSALLGKSELELVQALDRKPRKVYHDRYWGDCGFIHLCFDINGQDAMREKCAALGHPYTTDSRSSFDMGDAAGHFSYIEDPDHTLIEFVETHRIPIIRKLGWFLDLRRRDRTRPLPRWMLKTLSFGRVK
jgi:catechol 2,3-dioxygenase-like lactoylglutathione lyase family enzyme